MPKYILAPLAKKDMEQILRYTRREWGKSQAKKYTDEMKEQFEGIVRFPNKGKLCYDIAEECRKIQYKSHIIFYRKKGDDIEIGRILHKSMDIDNILH